MCTTEQTVSWNCNTKPSKKSNFSKKFVSPCSCKWSLWTAKLVVGPAWSTLVPPGRSTESRITSALLSSSLLPWALGHLRSRWDLTMALHLGVGYSLFWDNKVGFFPSFICFFPSKSELYHDICNDWSQMCRLTDKTVKISSPQHVWGTQTRYNICKWFCKKIIPEVSHKIYPEINGPALAQKFFDTSCLHVIPWQLLIHGAETCLKA